VLLYISAIHRKFPARSFTTPSYFYDRSLQVKAGVIDGKFTDPCIFVARLWQLLRQENGKLPIKS